jgi:hypothetical protein
MKEIKQLIDDIVHNISSNAFGQIGHEFMTNADVELDENYLEAFVFFTEHGGGPSPEDEERTISVSRIEVLLNGQVVDADDYLSTNEIELAFNK